MRIRTKCYRYLISYLFKDGFGNSRMTFNKKLNQREISGLNKKLCENQKFDEVVIVNIQLLG